MARERNHTMWRSPGDLEKIGENNRLRTPYLLANWIESLIKSYGEDGGDDYDYEPEPTSPRERLTV